MTTGGSERPGGVRYEPDERPPLALSGGLGLQLAVLCITGVALTPAIVVRAAGGAESYLTWAVFAAVLVSGVTSVLQARRIGRIGAGYVLVMGTSGAFIAICVAAIAQGGPAMLADPGGDLLPLPVPAGVAALAAAGGSSRPPSPARSSC